MTARHVCFSHGQESGPWGTKIRRLADYTARRVMFEYRKGTEARDANASEDGD